MDEQKKKTVAKKPAEKKKSATVKEKTAAEKKKQTPKTSAAKTSSSKTSSAAKKSGGTKKESTKKTTSSASTRTKTASSKRAGKKVAEKASSPKTKKVGEAKKTTKTAKKTSTVKKTTVKKTPVLEEKDFKKYIISETAPEEVVAKKTAEKKEEQHASNLAHEVPFMNYIIAFIIILWICILVFLGVHFYQKHQEERYDSGYFNSANVGVQKVSINQVYEKLGNASEEEFFVLFNFRGEKEYYDLEKELETIIRDNELEKKFYYVDVTDYAGTYNCNVVCIVNQTLETTLFEHLPAIAYIKNNKIVDIAQREDENVLQAADFMKLLDMYELKK